MKKNLLDIVTRTSLKLPTNFSKKMSSVNNNNNNAINNSSNLKLNGRLIGLSKPTIQQHQQHQQQQHLLTKHHSQHPQQQQQHHQPPPPPLPPSSSSSQSTTSPLVSTQYQLQQQQQHSVAIHSAPAPSVPQQIPTGLHHSHSSNSVQSVLGGGHTIPPRYQPPPQPSGGILKHVPSPKQQGYYPADANAAIAPHLNIKYPPDIPKLASVYIPEPSKQPGPALGQTSRFAPRPPPHRLTSAGGHLQVHHDDHLQRSGIPQVVHQSAQHHQDMLKFVRKPDPDPGSTPGSSSGSLIPVPGRGGPEQNRHLQPLLTELRALKDANQRLCDENQELRDLCCFLDDDRQKGRKLAREWQRFGRYTASVMRQEVSAYQNKLRQLDDKQQELIRDNLELKELCLYLDEERALVAANTLCSNCGGATRPSLRDDGDGSSSSTNADDAMNLRQYDRQIPDLNIRSALSDQTLQYVRSLERRIRQLEGERMANGLDQHRQKSPDPISGRPEAVVRALQVLEVREQLERDRNGTGVAEKITEQMDEGEKALVREMCNVVWRKLEDSPNGPNIDPI